MNNARFVYNWVVARKEYIYQNKLEKESYMKHRKVWMELIRSDAPWIAEAIDKPLHDGRTPTHVLYQAMMNAEQDYALAVRKRSQHQVSKLPFCSRKKQRSFPMLGNAVAQKGIYPRILGFLKTKHPLPEKPCDSRIIYEGGKWYLCYPYKVKAQASENQGRVCALDPGVRTFLTVFSPTSLHKIRQGEFGRIVSLLLYLDKLLSRRSKAKSNKLKRSISRAAERMRVRIKNLVDDVHYQSIGWLFRNYDTVIISEADFTDACRKASRKIRKKSVRSLMTWAFARFRDRLCDKAEVLGKQVVIVNEAYTSKTANWTGEIIQNLGGRKTITSGSVTVDRDVNGALGIFLKALVDHPPFSYENGAMTKEVS